ncbi:MAG: sugar ABC transporter ATP-binding protein, partial [Shinella sp.]|nr:sugar ABC transporter ATP-binding protein [Shinella sp.]
IYVTHDQVEAMTLADRIVALDNGRIQQVGPPLDLYARPNNLFVAGFIGSPRMNFLKARVVATDAGYVTVALINQPDVKLSLPIQSSTAKPGDEVSLGVRPEHFRPAGQGDADLVLDVDVAEHLGNTSYVYANVSPDERIIVEHEGFRGADSRDRLTVGLSASTSFLFDSAGIRIR